MEGFTQEIKEGFYYVCFVVTRPINEVIVPNFLPGSALGAY